MNKISTFRFTSRLITSTRSYSTSIQNDLTGFMKDLDTKHSNKEGEDKQQICSIFDPLFYNGRDEPITLELKKQRLQHLINTKPIEYIFGLPLVENSSSVRKRWNPHFHAIPPAARIYSTEAFLGNPELHKYYPLITHQPLRKFTLKRIQNKESIGFLFFKETGKEYDFKRNTVKRFSENEFTYLKCLSQLYNIHPHPEILNHVEETAPLALDVMRMNKAHRWIRELMDQYLETIHSDFGSLETKTFNEKDVYSAVCSEIIEPYKHVSLD